MVVDEGGSFVCVGFRAGMPAANAHNSLPLSCACAERQCSVERSFVGVVGRFFVAAFVPGGRLRLEEFKAHSLKINVSFG